MVLFNIVSHCAEAEKDSCFANLVVSRSFFVLRLLEMNLWLQRKWKAKFVCKLVRGCLLVKYLIVVMEYLIVRIEEWRRFYICNTLIGNTYVKIMDSRSVVF
jgi:hypothetical protein